MKDKLTSFGRIIRIFEVDSEYEENRMKIGKLLIIDFKNRSKNEKSLYSL